MHRRRQGTATRRGEDAGRCNIRSDTLARVADHLGIAEAANVLAEMDDYYADLNRGDEPVLTQLLRQLADPRPRDDEVTRELASYKGLDARWHDWSQVTTALRELVQAILR